MPAPTRRDIGRQRCRPPTTTPWARSTADRVCADESVHERASLQGLRERYDAVNIKLDKTAG